MSSTVKIRFEKAFLHVAHGLKMSMRGGFTAALMAAIRALVRV